MVSITAKESVGIASVTSRASTTTDFPSYDQRPEDLSNEELLQAVQNIQAANRRVYLENEMFENYLKRADPPALLDFDKLLEQATAAANAQTRVQAITSSVLLPLSSAMSVSNLSMRRGTDESGINLHGSGVNLTAHKSYSVMKFGTGSVLERGPRINLSHKVDMVVREMEELRMALEKMRARYKRTRADLKAQIEQSNVTIVEIKHSDEELTRNIIVGAINPLTHTIPGEKFIRHMEEWFKHADSISGKLRLKTGTLHSLNIRTELHLVQKIDLGETLHAVDFESLRIENTENFKKLERKNRHLLEMKKMTGKSNLQLTQNKDRLARELLELKTLEEAIAAKYSLIESLNEESELVQTEIEKAIEKLQKVKCLREDFTVPEVLEYAKVKNELTALRKKVKVWTRRLTVQHTSLVSCLRALQGIVNTRSILRTTPELPRKKEKRPSLGEGDNMGVECDSISLTTQELNEKQLRKESIPRVPYSIRASIGSRRHASYEYFY